MKTKLKFASDEEATKFEQDLAALFAYLKRRNQGRYLMVLGQVLNDNVNLFNKVKELENERTNKGT